ncbi:hypothetical protein V8D89_007948 [Ganoderma adspersum]
MEELVQPNPQMPSLDIDLLDTICAFLTDYPDLFSLSLTSSVLRPLAIRNVLRNHPVVLKNVDAIFKFHDFVFADPDSRLQHVTALKIVVAPNESDLDSESERAIESLLAILSQAPSLTSLELLSGWKLGYLDDPRISAAICLLETLRELKIAGKLKAVNFIGAVRSPLAKLALWFMSPADALEWTSASLCTTLSHLAQSLESLTIKSSNVRLVGGLPDSPSPLTQFHTVRSLTLDYFQSPPDLPLLLELFPNLDGTLHLVGNGYEDPNVDWDPDDDSLAILLRTTREDNGRAQDGRSWTRLARLISDVETLFVLNLRCPIGLIVLHQCPIDEDRVKCLAQSLRESPPTKLNLQFVFGGVGLTGVEYEGMIPPEAAATLTHLTLCIKYEYTRCGERRPVYDMQWGELWPYSILPALQHGLHSLTHLRLVFHCEALCHADSDFILKDALLANLRPVSFDFAAIASAIVDEIPSLRYCFLTVGAWIGKGCPHLLVERWCESRAWRVVHRVDDIVEGADGTCGSGRRLVELHNDVAETIIAKDDLGVSMDEAASSTTLNDMHWDRSDAFGGMYE